MRKYFSLKEVAEYLSVSDTTVRRLFRNGSIQTVKVGKLYRTTEEYIQDYLNRSQAGEGIQTARRNTPIRKIEPLYINKRGNPVYVVPED